MAPIQDDTAVPMPPYAKGPGIIFQAWRRPTPKSCCAEPHGIMGPNMTEQIHDASERFRSIVRRMMDDEEFRSRMLRHPKAVVLYQVGPLNDDEQLMLVHLAETWSDPETRAELAVIRQQWAADVGEQPAEG